MSYWKFNSVSNLEDLLLNSIELELLLPSTSPGVLKYFHNGDKMTINLTTGAIEWEPIEPGSFTTSKLAIRFHQWFMKGLIHPVNPTSE